MKKKIFVFLILSVFTFFLSGINHQNTVKAEEMKIPSYINITQNPSKTVYTRGENLDLTGMIVECYYNDGSSSVITDYTVEGYDCNRLGVQTVLVKYQNVMAYITVTVNPAKVSNISTSGHSSTSITLTWNSLPEATSYDIYILDDATGIYNQITSVYNVNSATFNYLPGSIHSYRICAISDVNGIRYVGELSDPFTAATDPEQVTGLMVTKTAPNQVEMVWSPVNGATGYRVFRYDSVKNKYTYCGKSSTASFIDNKVSAGKKYMYSVSAYTFSDQYSGIYSSIITAVTNPAEVPLKCKAGDQKIRLTWSKVTGASAYDIFMGDESGEFTLLTSKTVKESNSYIVEELATGFTYSFYVVAHMEVDGKVYDSPVTSKQIITLNDIENTSITARYFPTAIDFKKSDAYKGIEFFKKNIIYSKSIIIPGLINTNVAGFTSNSMCPQGITFTDKYLLLTAYDLVSEENSVIYVMNKSSKKLLTTLVLPNKTHAGGICSDGTSIWISNGTKISSILLSDIDSAVNSGEAYVLVDFNSTEKLNIAASYITYYDNKIWVGSYNELKSTYMYSYTVDYTEAPTIYKVDTVLMPDRVQGIAFTKDGKLILSRSCQLYTGLRGYMRQLDIYQPDLTYENSDEITLGECINTIEMPSMNEGIAVNGSYLYVNFESGAFDTASYKMDRICAFKLTSILKKPEDKPVDEVK